MTVSIAANRVFMLDFSASLKIKALYRIRANTANKDPGVRDYWSWDLHPQETRGEQ
jgi:hypothetical protein